MVWICKICGQDWEWFAYTQWNCLAEHAEKHYTKPTETFRLVQIKKGQ